MPEKVRVFIGSGPRFEEPAQILINSIYENTNYPDRVDVSVMEAWTSEDWSDWEGQPAEENFGLVKGNWVTPFSLFRYAIPSLCMYDGYAIYLDCDMIVLGDITDLYAHRKPGKWCTAPNRDGDCVTVMDCSALMFGFEGLKRGRYGDKRRLRAEVQPITDRSLPPEWNSCDSYIPGKSKLVHYTGINTQPWQPYPEVIDYREHPDREAVRLYWTWHGRLSRD